MNYMNTYNYIAKRMIEDTAYRNMILTELAAVRACCKRIATTNDFNVARDTKQRCQVTATGLDQHLPKIEMIFKQHDTNTCLEQSLDSLIFHLDTINSRYYKI